MCKPDQSLRKPRLADLGDDLLELTLWQQVRAILLPLGSFAAYWPLAYSGHWVLAVLSLMVLSFTTYGSTSHDLVHRNLGLPPWLNQLLLSIVEVLALRSGHAYQAAHLHHHARYPHSDDIEADASRMTFLRALWEGVIFQARICKWAWKHAPGQRRWIAIEGAVVTCSVVASLLATEFTLIPFAYVVLMVAGSWIIPLITSYLPHDAHGDSEIEQTRRYRGTLIRLLSFDHLYHLEHHMYPAVPHVKWRILAGRLDPWLDKAGVQSIRLWF
ncbi:fatty acid desaturase family protein [Adhaeretor mobilis]|uniref:Fatty acid desaturase n=1 Tax=Adhaeretor mobilis TaxID=1930276 RepID=A0A517MYR3_9BACT|nr:fatty acid desaturase [Adhaeretor mobilis]QDT00023.1 Fatty acid desaturase [Adhaeretor mobilis]